MSRLGSNKLPISINKYPKLLEVTQKYQFDDKIQLKYNENTWQKCCLIQCTLTWCLPTFFLQSVGLKGGQTDCRFRTHTTTGSPTKTKSNHLCKVWKHDEIKSSFTLTFRCKYLQLYLFAFSSKISVQTEMHLSLHHYL